MPLPIQDPTLINTMIRGSAMSPSTHNTVTWSCKRPTTQCEDCYLIFRERRNRRRTTRLKNNRLPVCVLFSPICQEQSSWGSDEALVHKWVKGDTAWLALTKYQLNWQTCRCPVFFTDKSMFTVSMCDRHEWFLFFPLLAFLSFNKWVWNTMVNKHVQAPLYGLFSWLHKCVFNGATLRSHFT